MTTDHQQTTLTPTGTKPIKPIAHWDTEVDMLLANILAAPAQAEARDILVSALNATYSRGFSANDT
jgi:hypothetical protein